MSSEHRSCGLAINDAKDFKQPKVSTMKYSAVNKRITKSVHQTFLITVNTNIN